MQDEKPKKEDQQLSDEDLESVSGGTGDDMSQGTGGKGSSGQLEPPGGN